MTVGIDNPFLPLSFIAGPAVLTNACAVMQNGATMRYSLAVTQWRDFNASFAARDGRLAALYTDPDAVLSFAGRRIRLLLGGLSLLYAAVGLFGATAFLGLVGSFLAAARHGAAAPVAVVMVGAGGLGLAALLGATVAFALESGCTSALLRLHVPMIAAVPDPPRVALAPE